MKYQPFFSYFFYSHLILVQLSHYLLVEKKRRLTLCLDEKRRDTFQLLFLLFSSSLHCFNLYQTCPYQSFSTTFIINQYLIVLVISLDHKKERRHICKFWYSGVVSLSIDSSIYKSMES